MCRKITTFTGYYLAFMLIGHNVFLLDDRAKSHQSHHVLYLIIFIKNLISLESSLHVTVCDSAIENE